MNINTAMQLIAVAAIPLLFAITLHEAAHGWVASKCGDQTALMLGRVSINPFKHIDPFGTVILPIFMLMLTNVIFGWAKPVPVNWNNLKRPRRDMAIVALAGPIANLLMAFFWATIAKIAMLVLAGDVNPTLITLSKFIHLTAIFGIHINVILMILNLFPLPPLDGSRVVSAILPPNLAHQYEKIEPYGIWILLALIVFGVFFKVLWPMVQYVAALIRAIFGV